MKQCPTCKRTYADDGFTFCLADGALLSAPYDPAEKKSASTIRSSGPPPTAVLPDRPVISEPQPTIAAPSPRPEAAAAETGSDFTNTASLKFKPAYLVLFIGIPVLIGGIYLIYSASQRSSCPHFEMKCSFLTDGEYCSIHMISGVSANAPVGGALASLRPALAFQAPATGVTNVTWSASAGTVTPQFQQAVIRVNGLSGQTVTVKAIIESKSGCSETVSNSFVVPATPK